jgi:hypothetical protein
MRNSSPLRVTVSAYDALDSSQTILSYAKNAAAAISADNATVELMGRSHFVAGY